MTVSHDVDTDPYPPGDPALSATLRPPALWPGVTAALLCTAIYIMVGTGGTLQLRTSSFIHHNLTASAWLQGRLFVTDDDLIRQYLFQHLARVGRPMPQGAPTGQMADAYRDARSAMPDATGPTSAQAVTAQINREFGDYLAAARHDWVTLPDHPERHYSYWPPVPALLMLPGVYLCGPGVSDVLAGNLVGGVTVLFIYLMLRRVAVRAVPMSAAACTGFSVFYGLGTIQFWQSCLGQVWFLTAITATLFLVVALWLGLWAIERPGRIVAAGIALGLGFLSRNTIILAAPFFAATLWMGVRAAPKPFARFAAWGGLFVLTIVAAIGVQLWFNHARFGDPLDFGQGHLADNGGNPRFTPDFDAHGRFSPFFVPRNVFYYFLNPRLGVAANGTFDADGNSLFLISPALAYLVLAWRRHRDMPLRAARLGPWLFPVLALVQLLLVRDYTVGDFQWPDRSGVVWTETALLGVAALVYAILCLRAKEPLLVAFFVGAIPGTIALLLFHGTGFNTFGPRYLLDTLPLLLVLAVFGMRGRLSAWPLTLIAVSIAVNAWGTYRFRLEQF